MITVIVQGIAISLSQRQCRQKILEKLCSSHQCRKKTKSRAMTALYWRNINKDIDNLTNTCKHCKKLQNNQTKEPLIPNKVRPSHTIGTDFFHLNKEDFPLAVYYSKYFFVLKTHHRQRNSRTIVELTRQIFSEQGIPKEVRSDNDTQYNAQVFKNFAELHGFKHMHHKLTSLSSEQRVHRGT